MYGTLRGVPVSREPIWLPSKLPTAIKGYRYEIDPLDAQVLSSLSLAAAPSGTGELTISALAFAAGIVTFTAAAGQPTRCYTLLLTATRSDGQVSDYLFRLRVGNVLVMEQPQVPPAAGLGTAVVWP
jgi:hypothetical protein